MPYKTPFEVKLEAPVPPYWGLITEPFQEPVDIVPSVVIDVCPTYPAAIEIILPEIEIVDPSPLYEPPPPPPAKNVSEPKI